VVFDGVATGKAGHAARSEGENAIYKAIKDIEQLLKIQFSRISPLLGSCTLSVTVIETENKAHNIIPDVCRFVVDVRVNELYTLEEVTQIIQSSIGSTIQPRSLRLRSTVIEETHPLVMAGKRLGRSIYGSPTISDKALLPFPTLKMGPGDSSRSHTADEFIYTNEVREGIDLYIQLLNQLL
jgi:acetylornithine deacetylase